jgi:hypothetical protein
VMKWSCLFLILTLSIAHSFAIDFSSSLPLNALACQTP